MNDIQLYGSNLITHNDPFSVAFSIGNFNIYWYAIISLLGYVFAIAIYHLTIAYRYKISAEVGFYFVFPAIFCIFLGARIWSCVIEQIPIQNFFNFRNGGMAVQGGILGGVIVALIYFPLVLRLPKFHKRVVENGNTYVLRPSIWLYADAIVPTILIGQAIGRWGNFFNGEIYGQLVTLNPNEMNNLSWLKTLMPGVYDHMISQVSDPSNHLIKGALYQPLFLYESFFNIMLFILIYIFLPFFRQIKAGVITGGYFTGYGIIRMINESLRNSAYRKPETFVLNGLLLTAGVIIIIYCQFIHNWLRNYKFWKMTTSYFKNIHNKNKLKKLEKEFDNKQITKQEFNKTQQSIQYIQNFNKEYIKENFKRLPSEMCYFDGR